MSWLVLDEKGKAVQPVCRFLIDFIARDNRTGSVRSYAYDLLRWWRWLRVVDVEWNRATSTEVRDFVLWLTAATKPRRSARSPRHLRTGPYGTPCKHEHACMSCPVLQIDPRQRGRLIEIIQNLRDRIREARGNGWLGEVEGLQGSLDAATAKLNSLSRAPADGRPQLVDLGMPVFTDPAPPRPREPGEQGARA